MVWELWEKITIVFYRETSTNEVSTAATYTWESNDT
jgi:hypothetical protein